MRTAISIAILLCMMQISLASYQLWRDDHPSDTLHVKVDMSTALDNSNLEVDGYIPDEGQCEKEVMISKYTRYPHCRGKI